MTLDEAIKCEEEVAEEQEKAAKEWHENQVRKCELIPFAEMDYTHENECEECAEKHRQLAEWLKELKQLREQTRWIPVSEGLPKYSGEYIVNVIDMSVECRDCQAVEMAWFAHKKDYDFIKESEWRELGIAESVIAWMPKPEPFVKLSRVPLRTLPFSSTKPNEEESEDKK